MAMYAYRSVRDLSSTLSSRSDQRRGNDPVALFLLSVAIYVTLLCLATLGNSGLLRALSYVTAFAIFLVMATTSAYLPDRQKAALGFGLALTLYYYGFIGSVAFNVRELDYSVTIKMMMGPLFIIFGSSFESQNRYRSWKHNSVRCLFIMLAVLPFVLWLWQLASGQIAFGSTGGVSIFANRNNAGLYAVTLIALFGVLRGKPIRNVLVYVIAGVSFGTLGMLLAVIVALAMSVGGVRSFAYLAISFMSLIGVLQYVPAEFGIFARFAPIADSIRLLVDGRIDIRSVTYGSLVGMLHTTDLSFLFRLKHWLNLLNIMSTAPFENWIFGFGVGSSIRMSDAGLVPHNDYLRVLFECGVVTFAGFVSVIALAIYRCGRRWETVPLLAVVVYFFTENLLDNFVAMAVFFFCAGALAYRLNVGTGMDHRASP